MTSPAPDSTPDTLRPQLSAAHSSLLHIHKTLIDHERRRYERTHGSVNDPGELFQLLVNDPFFAWLRALSELIVAIDEALSSKDPADLANGDALLTQTADLLSPDENGTPFQREYFRALQESPEVAMTHGTFKLGLLRARKST